MSLLLPIILFFAFPSVSSFWGFGGGCGCLPPPPPPCFQPIQLPQLCLPQIPLCPPPSPCCGRKKREAVGHGMVTSTRRPLISAINSTITASLCNSIQLKALIDANLSVSSDTPQLSLHSAIRAKFGGEWTVFCVDRPHSSHVSFVSDHTSFCSSSNDKSICYVFKI